MSSKRIHYGVPGTRTACGVRHDRMTEVRNDVTCKGCRSTLKFATSFFTTNPSKIPQIKSGKSRKRRLGARP